jgi:hypothetical protein
MALFLVLISLSLCYFSPGDVFPALSHYHLQVLLLVPALVASIPGFVVRQARLPAPHYQLMIWLWFAVVLSLLMLRSFRGAWDAFLDFGVLVVIYFVVLTNAFTPARVRIVCAAIVVCALFMAVRGILAYHTGYMEDKLLHISFQGGTVIKRIRAAGIVNDANDLGQFLVVSLAMLGAFWSRRRFFRNLMLLTLPAAILIYGIYLTGSRGAMLGLVVIAFVLASARGGKLQSVILAGCVLMLLTLGQFGAGRNITMNEASAGGRIMAWGTGVHFFKTNPIFGLGFEQFTEFNDLTAHNSFVLCFAELGFFGYFFWMGLVVTAALGLQKLAQMPLATPADYELRRCVTTIRTAFYSYMVTSWFLSRTYDTTLYVLLALAAALIQHHRQLNPEATPIGKRWVTATFASQAASIVAIYATIRIWMQ